MAKKKSKNPFIRGNTYLIGFLFSFVFVFLIIANLITQLVTNDILDEIKAGCNVRFKDKPVNLANCLVKSDEARTYKIFDANFCSEKLKLIGEDLEYCKESLNKNRILIGIGNFMNTITKPVQDLSLLSGAIITMTLFVIGFTLTAITNLFRR